MSFDIAELRNSTVWQLYRIRDRIQLDPEYQRLSGIWAPDNRQLLIDTIINGFDVPKLYLHKFAKPIEKGGKEYDLAIVDGKQRLETIWNFIDGEIPLADDFVCFKDASVKAGGMTYRELGQDYPELKADFDGFPLAVMLIETDDLEMIEEMFSRLNEAAPLTAAEKRNAFGGPIPRVIRKLAKHPFFTKSIPFPNKRYRHYDLATKFLLITDTKDVVDTKKSRLDDFVLRFVKVPRTKTPSFFRKTRDTLEVMASVFTQRDSLLRQVGMITLYFHLFRLAKEGDWVGEITRRKFVEFEKTRQDNWIAAEKGSKKADLDLVEFERYAQSPNDGGAMRFRLRVILKQVFDRHVGEEDL